LSAKVRKKWIEYSNGKNIFHTFYCLNIHIRELFCKIMFNLIYYLYICPTYKLIVFKLSNDMDEKTLEFVTYCIGKLSVMLKLPQQEVYRRLKTSGILDEYIVPSYDVLHTFGSRYLMEDLTEYMKEKGVL